MCAEQSDNADGLPDGNGKPGEGLGVGLRRIWNVQLEQLFIKAMKITAPPFLLL